MGDGSEFGDEMSHSGMSGGAMSMHARQPSYEQLAMADYSHHSGAQGVYDPYLGASAAPYPPPANIYPPQQFGGDMGGGYHDQSQKALSHYYASGPEGYPGAGGAVAAGGSPPLDQFRESDDRRGSIASSSGFHSTQGSASAYGMSQDPFNASSSRVGSPRIASPPPPRIASPDFGEDPLRRGGTPTHGPL